MESCLHFRPAHYTIPAVAVEPAEEVTQASEKLAALWELGSIGFGLSRVVLPAEFGRGWHNWNTNYAGDGVTLAGPANTLSLPASVSHHQPRIALSYSTEVVLPRGASVKYPLDGYRLNLRILNGALGL